VRKQLATPTLVTEDTGPPVTLHVNADADAEVEVKVVVVVEVELDVVVLSLDEVLPRESFLLATTFCELEFGPFTAVGFEDLDTRASFVVVEAVVGNRYSSHARQRMRSPCVPRTVLSLRPSGHGPSGRPSQRIER